ncbi:MAG: hypothetical protein PHV07_05795 [Oscillospiraceae bacterium]|nr:hypothetical protein [Oscillospiraceae bacterium]
MRQGGGRRRAIARRERQRSLANKRPRRLVDFYLELVSTTKKTTTFNKGGFYKRSRLCLNIITFI